jgi:transposase
MDATTVAVDLAKDVFEVAVANRAHRIVDRKRLTRRQFDSFVEGLSAGTEVVMEACSTAHYWGRRCQARGLAVRLLPVQYVRPYVRRNKTDRTDTEAMLEANRCAGVQPVPVKSVDQQALQALHRVRTQWQATRTARVNMMRGLLREQGYPVPTGARTVLTRVTAILDDPTRALPLVLIQTVMHYPNAGRELGWFWVFPSHTLSTDPRAGIVRRHHISDSVVQKAVKAAAQKARIHKPVSVHTLRHSLPRTCC